MLLDALRAMTLRSGLKRIARWSSVPSGKAPTGVKVVNSFEASNEPSFHTRHSTSGTGRDAHAPSAFARKSKTFSIVPISKSDVQSSAFTSPRPNLNFI
jgi:hypothetical protein